jgi:hypothetical protein
MAANVMSTSRFNMIAGPLPTNRYPYLKMMYVNTKASNKSSRILLVLEPGMRFTDVLAINVQG